MTVKTIFEHLNLLINDGTTIIIRDPEMKILAKGNWFRDNILKYCDSIVECFTWQDDQMFFIDLKER